MQAITILTRNDTVQPDYPSILSLSLNNFCSAQRVNIPHHWECSKESAVIDCLAFIPPTCQACHNSSICLIFPLLLVKACLSFATRVICHMLKSSLSWSSRQTLWLYPLWYHSSPPTFMVFNVMFLANFLSDYWLPQWIVIFLSLVTISYFPLFSQHLAYCLTCHNHSINVCWMCK